MSQLDREETELLASYELDEWRPVAKHDAEIERYRACARATFRQDRHVDIHLSSGDLEAIQKRAIEEGVPYQTLMSSILHEYISGRLVENASPIRSFRSQTGSSGSAATEDK